MARNELDILHSKRHDKLDFFLKRHLDESVFNKIRMYEACIVVTGRRHKKTFDFVVLTDECIYLTQNPPKTIHEALHLSDVVAIELVDDYPDFLSGHDRESAQHVRIVYVSRTHKKRHKPHAGSNKYIATHDGGRRKFGTLGREEASTNQEALSSPETHKLIQNKHPREFALRKSEDFARQRDPGPTRADSCPTPELKNLKLCEKDNHVAWRTNARPLPEPPKESPGPTLASRVPTYKQEPVQQHPVNPYPCHRNTREQRSDRWDSSTEVDKRTSSQLKEQELELHLYIISMSSLIFLHLKSAWNNFMIRSTLRQDPDYAQESAPASPARGAKGHSSEGINKLFNQLSSELLHGSSALDRTCSLVKELKTAALRNFTIKKLFWKSNDLYPFLIGKLQEHLPRLEDPTTQRDRRKTINDLQFCRLIVETLGVMFRETETEPSRLPLLTAKRGILVVSLLKILISGPHVLKTPCTVGDGVSVERVVPAVPPSEELQNLLLEYSDAVISALYEIFLITHQGNWGSGSRNLMTVGWLMMALQKLPAMFLFIDHMVKHIIKTVLPPIHLMSPTEALRLFQQLYILNTCIQYGSGLAEHIRNKYSEEFRYYIQIATVEAMLPAHYAVTQPAMRLLLQVLSCILQKPV
ncbi:uncharacterized protein C12orf56 homolog [Amblyraja radiata]|uniref:uncharacterized protein C12orf56 homolog n=1 Tax=Amblyraja radiata TaxID=386614 RepID=UPI001403F286|nr:uncharacterized protein C12orf56 homolog [Amblyraja radiata]